MSTKWVSWMAVCLALLVSGAAFAVDTNKYHGGSYDGHDLAVGDLSKLDGTPFVFDLAKYHGGSYDGHAMEISASDIPLGVPTLCVAPTDIDVGTQVVGTAFSSSFARLQVSQRHQTFDTSNARWSTVSGPRVWHERRAEPVNQS